jgi:hypothetical protein
MPRASPEARGATSFQPDTKPHLAPKNLTPDERQVWYDIINSKPLDWFDQGSLLLLERYCVLAVLTRSLTEDMRSPYQTPLMRSFAMKELHQATMVMSNIAARCRLSVQAVVDRKSRMLDEKKGAGKLADDKLLGGTSSWGGAKLRAVQ